MKNKFLGFAIALLSLAVIGVVQLQADAAGHPSGKVGNAPVCTVSPVGKRGTTQDISTVSGYAYTARGNSATVKFRVTGPKDCKVRVTNNAFWTPRLNGKPWSQQVLFSKRTTVHSPGTYSSTIGLPSQPRGKFCHYQVDLTYGYRNVLPVIAYAHGKISGCKTPPKPQPKPAASCSSLVVAKLTDNRYKFTATASTKNGAKVNSYVFAVTKDGKSILSKTTQSRELTYTQNAPGAYQVKVTIDTTVGQKTAPACAKSFTVPKKPVEKNPGIEITKLVDGVKEKEVAPNTPFDYTISVKNTGTKDLEKVKVTDTPDKAITLVSSEKGTIEKNIWTYTIPRLGVGETMNFTLVAKVTKPFDGSAVNTVCVDTPTIPGNPDDCDDATVTTPPTPVTPPEEKPQPEPTPEDTPVQSLPQTGIEDVWSQMIGALSLTGASAYYLTSRRD